jgi:hypothetical protein
VKRAKLAVLSLCLVALAGACPADLTEPTEVIEPRLMGARVEVAGDVTRTRPHLGEAFTLRQYLALPGPLTSPLATRYSMQLALCLGVKTPTGLLSCLGDLRTTPVITPVNELELTVEGLALDPSALASALPMLVPAGTNLGELTGSLDRIALYGTLCVDGRAEAVPGKAITSDPPSQLFRCVDNAGAAFPAPNPFTLSVLLNRDKPGDDNHNPLFACDPAAAQSPCALGVLRDAEPMVPGPFVLARPKPKKGAGAREVVAWPSIEDNLALPWDGCVSNPSLLQVKVDSGEHTLRMRFDPSDRERYTEEIDKNGVPTTRNIREALAVTHAATTKGGDVGRFDSLLADDEVDEKAEVSVSYTPPDSNGKGDHRVPENGRLVRFYFTVRDQRGGIDYAVRELCLVPDPNQE